VRRVLVWANSEALKLKAFLVAENLLWGAKLASVGQSRPLAPLLELVGGAGWFAFSSGLFRLLCSSSYWCGSVGTRLGNADHG
jgi:hypothetical protein